MVSTLDTQLKKTCPNCQKKGTLTTNDVPKVDPIIHYRCLQCGCEFSENEEQAKAAEKKASSNKSGDESQPFAIWIVLIVVTVATIFAILLTEREESRNEAQQVSLQAQIER